MVSFFALPEPFRHLPEFIDSVNELKAEFIHCFRNFRWLRVESGMAGNTPDRRAMDRSVQKYQRMNRVVRRAPVHVMRRFRLRMTLNVAQDL